MNDELRSCLLSGQQSIPLQGVHIAARLRGLCSEVAVTQRYRNQESVPLECVYVFPLEDGAAVSGFQARIGKRVIVGRVEERDKAFETYDDAMADGHGAFLLDQERPNVFTASVGNLEPGTEVEITIRYVALLRSTSGTIRFMLPTTVSPRYVPSTLAPEIGEPDGERVNPERRLTVPYGLTLTVDIDMDSPIRVLESPSHTVRAEHDGTKAKVSLSSRESALDRDFVLIIETRDRQPSIRVAREEDGTRVAMVTFIPDIDDLPEYGGMEIDFVIDCSGSMRGDSIDEARRALALCVRAMSEADTFNIIRFGSSFTSLWPEARPYTQDNLDTASRYIQETYANMGGTEILSPLQQICGQKLDPSRPRQILLLTDGQVSNEDQVIALSRKHAQSTRIFAFGIGAGASEHLVRGVARASRGAADFIYPGERIESKVLQMFSRVSTPALTGLRMEWGGMNVVQTPNPVPPAFGGDSLTVFARIESGNTNRVALRSSARDWELAIDLEHAEADNLIPTLWARHAIQQLEDARPPRGSNQGRGRREDRKRASIVELGVRYGLMSSATSYVAVEERADDERTQTQAELRRVPIALTKGWGGRHPGARTMAGVAMSRSAPRMRIAASPPPHAVPFGRPSGPPSPPPPPGPAFAPRPTGGRAQAPRRPAPASPSAFRPPPAPSAPPAPMASYGPSKETLAHGGSRRQGTDRLFELLLSQQADGSFRMTAILEIWLGTRVGAVKQAIATHSEALVVTAVVVALLAKEASARQAEWTPAVRKAKRWLDKQGQEFDAGALL